MSEDGHGYGDEWSERGLSVTLPDFRLEVPWHKIDEMRAQFVPVDTGKPATGLVEFLLSTSEQFRDAPREGASLTSPRAHGM